MASSQFARNEIRDIIIAWIIVSVGISFSSFISLFSGQNIIGNYEFIAACAIASATGFILHEMGHKFVAVKYNYVAHFKLWILGLLLLILTAVGSSFAHNGGFLFGAPGAVYIAPAAAAGYYGAGYYSTNYRASDPARENMLISLAGPGLNLLFAYAFLIITFFSNINSFSFLVGYVGFWLNIGLGSFNMIPFPPLDGFKIFKKNILLGLAIALPMWIPFILFSGIL